MFMLSLIFVIVQLMYTCGILSGSEFVHFFLSVVYISIAVVDPVIKSGSH